MPQELIQDSSLTICTFLEGSILESHDLNVSGFSKLRELLDNYREVTY
jgi:hypothetical protein